MTSVNSQLKHFKNLEVTIKLCSLLVFLKKYQYLLPYGNTFPDLTVILATYTLCVCVREIRMLGET